MRMRIVLGTVNFNYYSCYTHCTIAGNYVMMEVFKLSLPVRSQQSALLPANWDPQVKKALEQFAQSLVKEILINPWLVNYPSSQSIIVSLYPLFTNDSQLSEILKLDRCFQFMGR